jgi:methylenetetrahydrofolate--tRNA-(uracil-5-)-methyltransferase
MKPVGLTNPHRLDEHEGRSYAIVQLRQDNALGTLYNMVGFQTKMKYGAQQDVFRMIPGLENAEFARLGGIHRNTFINSPKLLNETLQMKAQPRLRFAGQITGCEGYIESASVGLMTGRFAAFERLGLDVKMPSATTAMGSLLSHITGGGNADTFQPMNINFGLFPPYELSPEEMKGLKGKEKGRLKKQSQARRALNDIKEWNEAKLEIAA